MDYQTQTYTEKQNCTLLSNNEKIPRQKQILNISIIMGQQNHTLLD